MTFEELREQLQQLEVEERRFNLHDYVEFVIHSKAFECVRSVLEKYFGSPVNMQHRETAQEAMDFVEKWGGIRHNQTLYFLPRLESTDFAMVWPWCDGSRISIKVIQYKPFSYQHQHTVQLAS